MFALSNEPLSAAVLIDRLRQARAGGLVTFEGWVRNHNEGKEVLSLEYEAYEALALKEGERIIAEAKERFDILGACCVHRVGSLAIGESAVFVGASAQHRGPAFEACQYIIDEIKVRTPIWKKEYYTDGNSGWVNCEGCSHRHGKDATHVR